MALCLALVFSVSSVEAQDLTICMGFNFCDRDDDGWIRDHGKCRDCLEMAAMAGKGIDCDDSDPDEATGGLPCDGGEEGPGGGDGEGGLITPATITFMDGDIDSDDGAYEHGESAGVNVFMGSRANLGNIFLKGDGSFTAPLPDNTRLLFLDFDISICTSGGPCGVPTFFGEDRSKLVRAGFVVDVKKAVKDGVYAIGPPQTAPMRLQFHEDVDGNVAHEDNWFLYFDPKKKNCEASGKVNVENSGSGVWTVSGMGLTGCVVQQTGPNADPVGFFDMDFSFNVVIN